MWLTFTGAPALLPAEAQLVRTLGGWRQAQHSTVQGATGPPPRFFTQKLDHFRPEEQRTWQQAFFVNSTHWKGDGPVFLCVGGEGPPLTGAAVFSSVHCNIAVEHLEEFGALMFAIEHRYYGCHNMSACPYAATDAKPLKWLSSRQALADIAAFHKYATIEFTLPPKTMWVTFGGSYPGMLASWARLLYPERIYASISSSAPVHAKLDMPEYNDLVARAYSLPSVGGSASCREMIAAGHAVIGQMLSTPVGRSVLASKFATLRGLGPEWLESREHQARFAGDGVAAFPAQSNDPSCEQPACSVGKICSLLSAAPGSPVDKLAVLTATQMGAGLIQPHANRAALTEEKLLNMRLTSINRSSTFANAPLDYWGYQTCTEFGFYQTCEVGSGCFFTQGLVDLNSSIQFCNSQFGIAREAIEEAIERSNTFYGGLRPDIRFGPKAASRILYVNGDVDPWSALAILESHNPRSLPAIGNVSGASHHFWTHPSKPTDQKTVIEARGAIVSQLHKWLG